MEIDGTFAKQLEDTLTLAPGVGVGEESECGGKAKRKRCRIAGLR